MLGHPYLFSIFNKIFTSCKHHLCHHAMPNITPFIVIIVLPSRVFYPKTCPRLVDGKVSSNGALDCHIMLNKVLAKVDQSHAIRTTWQFCSDNLPSLGLHNLKCEGRLLTMSISEIACKPSLRILDKRWFKIIKKLQNLINLLARRDSLGRDCFMHLPDVLSCITSG